MVTTIFPDTIWLLELMADFEISDQTQNWTVQDVNIKHKKMGRLGDENMTCSLLMQPRENHGLSNECLECVQTYSENDLILANQNAIGVSRFTRRKLYDIEPTNHDHNHYLPTRTSEHTVMLNYSLLLYILLYHATGQVRYQLF